MSINLIGVRGRIGAGKDEVAQIIQYLTTPKEKISYGKGYNSFVIDVGMGFKPGWDVKKFAGKMKQIASILTGIPVEKFEDQEFKKTFLPKEWVIYRGSKDDAQGKAQHFVFKNAAEGQVAFDLGKVDSVYSTSMTVRQFLQRLGTEAMRDRIHPNTWVNALFADYEPGSWCNCVVHEEGKGCFHCDYTGYDVLPSQWIITDCRFPNEQEAIKERGGIVVRVNRALVQTEGNLHESETALDNHQPDWELDNNSDIPSLIEEVRKMLLHFNIQQ